MATALGKRKRRSQLCSPPPTDPSTTAHLQALFQQHFEAKYAPLSTPTLSLAGPPPGPPASPPSSSSSSAWEGLSADSSPPVQVISHSTRSRSRSKRAAVPREELRAFMVHRPLRAPHTKRQAS
ncbi:hypothetical protein MMC18_006695 [Xylographa bjoerkii]|nr:hypothetical protein [Xylographa bjoerkii]